MLKNDLFNKALLVNLKISEWIMGKFRCINLDKTTTLALLNSMIASSRCSFQNKAENLWIWSSSKEII